MSELMSAIKQICEEKNLDVKSVVSTIESALAAAYRKDFGQKNQNIVVKFNPETGASEVFDVKTVVEDLPEKIEDQTEEKETKIPSEENLGEEEKKFNPKTEIQLQEAKKIKKNYKVGDTIKTKLKVPDEYGRMAAQTAKQVIIQRLREAERETIYNEFKEKEHEVVNGIVQRREGRFVLVDLGKTVGLLLPEEQIQGERYSPGDRIKVYVKEVKKGSKGAEIILSRTSEEILKKVFYLEIPEISNGLVELKSIAREAGSRSKVAVYAESDNVDPLGSCVGQRGSRIQTIINELGGEKIDIIEYSDESKKYIANALSPAKVSNIKINEEKKEAIIKVPSDQLSLAIGKNGQNARLAAKLTGWKIDIIGEGEKENLEGEKGEKKSHETKSQKEEKSDKEKTKKEKNKKEESGPKKQKDNKKELSSAKNAESKKEKNQKTKQDSKPENKK